MGDLSGKSSGDQHAAKAVTCSSVDDQRAAAAIVTSLSGYVLTGSLAIIGAEIAIFALLVDKGRYPWWLFALYALTFVILLTSCYVNCRTTPCWPAPVVISLRCGLQSPQSHRLEAHNLIDDLQKRL